MRLKDGEILKDCTLDRKIKERGKIQPSVLLNQRTTENFLEISAKMSCSTLYQCCIIFYASFLEVWV